jgi:hypothetical protein
MNGRESGRLGVVAWSVLSVLALSLLLVPAARSATPPRIVKARTSAATALPSTIDQTTVQAVTLQSGPWTVLSRAFVVDKSADESDYFRCGLYDAGTNAALDRSAGWVGNEFPANMITNLAKLKVPRGASVTIEQRCWHDHFDIANAYLDPGATILAFKALSRTGNRLYRTTSSTGLPSFDGGGSPLTVATLGIGSGTWLFGFKATAVNVTSAHESVSCDLPGAAHASANVSADGAWSRVTTFSAFGVVTSVNGETLTVDCIDALGPGYLDPDVVLWARKVSSGSVGDSCGTVAASSGASDLVVDERTSVCSIGVGKDASQVGGTAVGAGSWVVLGAEHGLYASIPQFVRCRATDVTHNRTLDGHAAAWVRGHGGTTYLGTVTSSDDVTVEFRCGHDSATGTVQSDWAFSYVLLRP